MPPAARSSDCALQRMPAFPLARDLGHGAEAYAGAFLHMLDQPVEHQQTMAAANDLRMHGQTIHARADEIAQIIEITRPSLLPSMPGAAPSDLIRMRRRCRTG